MGEDGYDIVILGSGSGGMPAPCARASWGKRVALIEKDKVGGTCHRRGCIPTKALPHAAEIADHAREGASFGVPTALGGIDGPALALTRTRWSISSGRA